jgi:HlyD family secretion protein
MVKEGGGSFSFKYTAIFLFLCIAIACGCYYGLSVHEKNVAALELSINTSGSLESTEVMMGFKIAGKVSKVLVKEGQEVKTGDIIAILESQEIAAKAQAARGALALAEANESQASTTLIMQKEQSSDAVKAARETLNKAQANYNLCKASYDRIVSLFQQGAVSQQTMDETETKYLAAQADLGSAQTALDIAVSAQRQVAIREAAVAGATAAKQQASGVVAETQANLDNCVLKAPIDGVITQVTVDPGEMVSAGTPVAVVSDPSQSWVKIYVGEDKIGKLKVGQKAAVKFDAFPDQVFKGKISYINPVGDFATRKAVTETRDHDIRTFAVKIDIDNSSRLLRAGMTAYVDISNVGGKD